MATGFALWHEQSLNIFLFIFLHLSIYRQMCEAGHGCRGLRNMVKALHLPKTWINVRCYDRTGFICLEEPSMVPPRRFLTRRFYLLLLYQG